MIKLEGEYNRDCKIFAHEIEDNSLELIQNILNEKATENARVRIMPDTHLGKGIVIGFTMPLTDRVNPFHIGVTINYNKRYNTDFNYFKVDSKYIEKMLDRIHIKSKKFYGSLGTLGGGNHFIEIGASDNNDYYLTIHSGSRNFKIRVCNYHVDKNKRKIDSTTWFFENIEHINIKEKKDTESGRRQNRLLSLSY